MSKFRLYVGLVRNNEWYNHCECQPLQGGTLAMLDSGDKTGAARMLTILKGSVVNLQTEDGKEYKLNAQDYPQIALCDTWKIGYEQIKITLGEEYPVIRENFFCDRCSHMRSERYTEINESWQKLVDNGLIDEIYAQTKDSEFKVELPDPIEIQGSRTFAGGSYNEIIMRPITLGDMINIHKNQMAQDTEANLIYASWDASIVKIVGMSEKDFNILKRVPYTFFTKEHIKTQANRDAIELALEENAYGIDARDRKVTCKYCGSEIGGYLDFTNFFLPLLPKRQTRNHIR